MSPTSRRLVRIATPAAIAAVLASMVLGSPAGAAHSPVGLGTATSFAVLAGSGITNDIPGTVITGDVGSFPTATITNTGNWTLNGVNHAGDAVTQGAKVDLQTAYNDAAGRLPETAQDSELGGETKTPGVYAGGAVGLTGVLTLDFGNDVDALFVFKMASTLVTAAGSSVVMTGAAADACRVVWVVGSSATFGANSSFVGDALVHTSISANTGASFRGRLLALNGAVTLLDNTIDKGGCATVAPSPVPVTSATTTSTTSTTVRPTTTTTRPVTTTTSTTSTTLPAVITTTDATPTAPTPTPAPTTIAPTVAGQGQQTPPTPPGTPTGTPTTPGTPPALPELPRTGTGTLALAVTGAVLVVLGAAAVRIERRVRAPQLV